MSTSVVPQGRTVSARSDLHDLLASGYPRLVVQPIIDLVRGTVVGHEALSRFPDHTPDVWFAAAKSAGLAGRLEARAITQALDLMPNLPDNTFLTVNIDPSNLLAPEVAAVLDGPARLDRLVVEFTEHSPVSDDDELRGRAHELQGRGALVALDDLGAGWAGLQTLLRLRPDLAKIDRSLVDHIDTDPAKQAMVQMLGDLTGRMDAWLLAEGIERPEELVELIRLGVPLGQGYLLGRPGPAMIGELPTALRQVITDEAARTQLDDVVAGLVDPAPRLDPGEHVGDTTTAVVVDGYDRPAGLWFDGRLLDDPLRIKPSESVAAVAQRMADRTGPGRQAPAVVVNGQGSVIGMLDTNRLLGHMAGRLNA